MRAILTYHSIDRSGSAISLDPDHFTEHLRWLSAGHVRVVRLEELPTLPDGADAVALAFDDAFESAGRLALAPLAARGLPATVFVATAHVGGDNRWASASAAGPVFPLLGWARLEALLQDGIAIGAHTRTHPRLSRCSLAEIEDEVCGSAADLEARLGVRPISFAYPYGDAPARARQVAARTFAFSCTTELAPLADDAADALPRIDAWYLRDPRRLQQWGTPAFRRWLRVRRVARAVRRAVLG